MTTFGLLSKTSRRLTVAHEADLIFQSIEYSEIDDGRCDNFNKRNNLGSIVIDESETLFFTGN